MLQYLVVREFDNGQLLQTEDGKPLTRPVLVKKGQAALCLAGMDPYTGHSFRIRVATTATSKWNECCHDTTPLEEQLLHPPPLLHGKLKLKNEVMMYLFLYQILKRLQ